MSKAQAKAWGRSIRKLRVEKMCMTQEELAEVITDLAAQAGRAVSVDQATVSRWESGAHEPALRLRPWIARALETDTFLLFAALPDEAMAS